MADTELCICCKVSPTKVGLNMCTMCNIHARLGIMPTKGAIKAARGKNGIVKINLFKRFLKRMLLTNAD